jgi:chromosome segregation ATPase
LIVLLTVASIFLCGIVATYVANAQDWKDKYDKRNNEVQTARADATKANEDFNKLKDDTDRLKTQLNAAVADLQSKLSDLEAKLNQSEREKSELLTKVNGWTSVVQDFQQTNDKQQSLLNNTLDELHNVQAELTKEKSQNKEITTAILEKMAVIAQLEEQSKQLNKEKSLLQARLEQVVRQYGKTVLTSPPPAVDTIPDKAQATAPAPPAPVGTAVKEIGLKGVITQVDLKNSLAEISIGAADGVKEKMKFYVTRGDSFICNILILDVDAERAVGFIELVQSPPKVGDKVSTNIGP